MPYALKAPKYPHGPSGPDMLVEWARPGPTIMKTLGVISELRDWVQAKGTQLVLDKNTSVPSLFTTPDLPNFGP